MAPVFHGITQASLEPEPEDTRIASDGQHQARSWRQSAESGHTDFHRWTDPASFPEYWEPRAAAAAAMIRTPAWVCDIGCGAQALQRHLPAGSRYLPADIRQWTRDVEPCELNAGRLPVRALARCDVAVLLGVLEYILDPKSLLARIATRAEQVLLSYCAPELWEVDRAGFGWVNALSIAQLDAMLADAGYVPVEDLVFEGRQRLILARRPAFSRLDRIRRAVARVTLLPVLFALRPAMLPPPIPAA